MIGTASAEYILSALPRGPSGRVVLRAHVRAPMHLEVHADPAEIALRLGLPMLFGMLLGVERSRAVASACADDSALEP